MGVLGEKVSAFGPAVGWKEEVIPAFSVFSTSVVSVKQSERRRLLHPPWRKSGLALRSFHRNKRAAGWCQRGWVGWRRWRFTLQQGRMSSSHPPTLFRLGGRAL